MNFTDAAWPELVEYLASLLDISDSIGVMVGGTDSVLVATWLQQAHGLIEGLAQPVIDEIARRVTVAESLLKETGG